MQLSSGESLPLLAIPRLHLASYRAMAIATSARRNGTKPCFSDSVICHSHRPTSAGSLSFFDDSQGDHGVAFVDEVTNLEVVDVPGNHYTLLHQEDEDMVILLEQMQTTLSSHGIGEMAKVNRKTAWSTANAMFLYT